MSLTRHSYSHGFLFPSYVESLRSQLSQFLSSGKVSKLANGHSTVSSFGSTFSYFGSWYKPLVPGLPIGERVEALVEGSELSLLRGDRLARNTSEGSSHSQSTSQPIQGPSKGSGVRYENSGAITGAAFRQKVQEIYNNRPTRAERFLGDPEERGGTVLVHYVKSQEWFCRDCDRAVGYAGRTRSGRSTQ